MYVSILCVTLESWPIRVYRVSRRANRRGRLQITNVSTTFPCACLWEVVAIKPDPRRGAIVLYNNNNNNCTAGKKKQNGVRKYIIVDITVVPPTAIITIIFIRCCRVRAYEDFIRIKWTSRASGRAITCSFHDNVTSRGHPRTSTQVQRLTCVCGA